MKESIRNSENQSSKPFPNSTFVISEDTVECIWRSSQFRAAIRRKFDEVIVTDDANVNSQAIEEQLFVKAKTQNANAFQSFWTRYTSHSSLQEFE